jgi:muramoyltetrapeptide carboxypeptidase LdcA involved in peptidoglycan recycling
MDVDFGHTDAKLILPLGVPIEVDPAGSRLRLLESPFL